MTRTTLFVTLVAVAASLLGGLTRQNVPSLGKSKQGEPQIPARLTVLTDLQLLQYAPTPLDKLEVLVRWLAEEKRQPSKTTVGLGEDQLTADTFNSS